MRNPMLMLTLAVSFLTLSPLVSKVTSTTTSVIFRSKRSFGSPVRDKACELLIAIDEPLYVKYHRNLHNLTGLVRDYVRRLNVIYYRTLLTPSRNFGEIYFRLKEVRVLFDFCTECNQTQTVYLREFTKMNFRQFCLAHVFTYRDFPKGIQGLAWKGTLCKTKYNTGFTTLLNHQVESSVEDSVMTFAHEIGHNFGSQHDEDVGCSSEYIMSESGTSRTNPKFSQCSLSEMSAELRSILRTPYRDCFVYKLETDPDDFAVCGNGIVEGYEECDCGMDYRTCSDPCCYAARISPSDLYYNSSATPCRRNRKDSCLYPWKSVWIYGFIAPWIFIGVVIVLLVILLTWDWNHSRIMYKHVTQPKQLIRTETADQLAKRRQRLKIYSVTDSSVRRPTTRPPPSPPPPPPPPRTRPSVPPILPLSDKPMTSNGLHPQQHQ